MERLLARATFDGPVETGASYVIVDDVTVMGSTLADMAAHIQANGGIVVGVITLANASRVPHISANKAQMREIERRFGMSLETNSISNLPHSPEPRQLMSSTSETLTPSEQESLRLKAKEDKDFLLKALPNIRQDKSKAE